VPLLKLCGLTSIPDAEVADKYADYAGFIVGPAETPRRLPARAAADIASTLSRAVPVLVSTHNTPGEAVDAYASLGVFRVLQYHGRLGPWEAAALVEGVRELGGSAAIVVGVAAHAFTPAHPAAYAYMAPGYEYILVDPVKSARHPIGPMGLRIPLSLVAGASPTTPRLAVAGGVNPYNAPIVASMNPYMVDVSSGVEDRPGHKDEVLVEMLARGLGRCTIR